MSTLLHIEPSAQNSPLINGRLVKDIHVVGKNRLETVIKHTFRPVANFWHQALKSIHCVNISGLGSCFHKLTADVSLRYGKNEFGVLAQG